MKSPRGIPDQLLGLMAAKFAMLGDETRLAILRALMPGEMSVGRVVEETGKTQGNVSKHLKLLAGAGLVSRRKEGLQVFYRLSDPLVEKLCRLVCDTIVAELGEQAEIHRAVAGDRTQKPIAVGAKGCEQAPHGSPRGSGRDTIAEPDEGWVEI